MLPDKTDVYCNQFGFVVLFSCTLCCVGGTPLFFPRAVFYRKALCPYVFQEHFPAFGYISISIRVTTNEKLGVPHLNLSMSTW